MNSQVRISYPLTTTVRATNEVITSLVGVMSGGTSNAANSGNSINLLGNLSGSYLPITPGANITIALGAGVLECLVRAGDHLPGLAAAALPRGHPGVHGIA